MKHVYGWRPDKPDHRDRYRRRLLGVALPPFVDLTDQMPAVYDQGELGSCTGNALAAAVEFARKKQKLDNFVPSRLFIYYNERSLEGTVSSDAGAEIRDGIASLMQQGACSETEWPYDVSKFTDAPPAQCYTDAKKDLVTGSARVDQTIDGLRECLAVGFPVVFGFTVYDSFESPSVAASGVVPMPGPDEQVLGGHAVVAVGYDDDHQMFIIRNSWGAAWGRKGYFLMPYAYLCNTDLASDFWQIDAVSASG